MYSSLPLYLLSLYLSPSLPQSLSVSSPISLRLSPNLSDSPSPFFSLTEWQYRLPQSKRKTSIFVLLLNVICVFTHVGIWNKMQWTEIERQKQRETDMQTGIQTDRQIQRQIRHRDGTYMHASVCLSVSLSVCLFVCLSVCLNVCYMYASCMYQP